ncbi:hypothetical protein FC85_GL000492 [Lentilactobacillus diolivorans DSM 14421]|uniref:Uncharacterized protein n=2 Tax=Lentilactobacillus diolivorans TaxID=179838 RepID=A0A0R1S9R6_9LACO|nr:hypothetical protein FC85_GL000492 [Lentilactobacillus diolivorans DSM 14421]
MKCIPFRQQGVRLSITDMLHNLLHDYETIEDEINARKAYRYYLLITKCLAVSSNFDVSDFMALLKNKRPSLKSGPFLIYDDVSDEDVEIKSFELIKNIKGKGKEIGPSLHQYIIQAPIFELRINSEGFGFRSILFLSSKEFNDEFDQFQCYCDCFRKEKYDTSVARHRGHRKTNQAILSTTSVYQLFRSNESLFESFFASTQIIAMEGEVFV